MLSACSILNKTHDAPSYTLATGGQGSVKQQKLTLSHADLRFIIHPNRKRLEGSTTLSLSSEKPLDEVFIDLDSTFTIQSIKLNGRSLNQEEFTHKNGLITLHLNASINNDFKVSIDYKGKPRIAPTAPWDGGFVWSKTVTGEPWIATAVQGEGCDLFWPCIDQPFGEPESLDIHVDVPQNLVAATNGVLQGVTTTKNRKTYHWKTKSTHNTYGVSLNIAPYEALEAKYHSRFENTVDMVYYYLPENKEKAEVLFSEFPKLLTFFEQVIGPYPFASEKMGVAETPHLGMEHQTINAYGNAYKADKYGFDWLLQHEFSHEWFGNQMTNDDWDHMWLHEGFASYLQPLYAQYLHGDLAYHAYLYERRLTVKNQFPLVSKQSKAGHEVYDEETGPAGDIYAKGAMILHSLRQLIGDEAFFKAVKRLLYGTETPTPENIAPRFANTQEFIEIVNDVSGRDLQWFFDAYVFNAKLPSLEVNRTDTAMTFKWQTENNIAFPMPLELKVNGVMRTLDINQSNQLTVNRSDIVIVDPNSKILREEDYISRYQKEQEELAELKEASN